MSWREFYGHVRILFSAAAQWYSVLVGLSSCGLIGASSTARVLLERCWDMLPSCSCACSLRARRCSINEGRIHGNVTIDCSCPSIVVSRLRAVPYSRRDIEHISLRLDDIDVLHAHVPMRVDGNCWCLFRGKSCLESMELLQ